MTTPDPNDWDSGVPLSEQQDGFDDFDTGGVDASRIGSGRVAVDRIGWYHLAIESATARPHAYEEGDMSKPRKPDILLTCVVQHSAPDQSPAGSTYFHNLVLGGKGQGAALDEHDRNKTLNVLVGLGICKNVDGRVIDPETGTTRINSATLSKRLQGLHFIGNIRLNKSKDPQYPDRIELIYGSGAFAIDDPQVSHVPKNAAALKAIGKEHVAAGTHTTATQPASTKPTSTQHPTGGTPAKNPLDDLPGDL